MKENSCLVIAGEKSGEDHAMTFFPELIKLTPGCEYFGVGGDRLKALGMELKYHLNDFSGMGISEVLTKIPFYYKALDIIVDEVKKRNTKTAILIDFQGFNLKLAKELKRNNVNVLYYVAPQAWVWKPWRAKVLEKNVHTLFTILPFEKKWFESKGVSKVRSVLHPLMIEHESALNELRHREFKDMDGRKKRLLLLTGSRNMEGENLLKTFIRGAKLIAETYDIEVGIVKSESVKKELYESDLAFSKIWPSSKLTEALDWADVSVAASGTVTLATGLFQVPTVVCYKVSMFTEMILKLFIPYDGPASLTNIIHGSYLFPEFIQNEADRYNIAFSIIEWLSSETNYNSTVDNLKNIGEKLTGENFSVPEYMAGVIKEV
jgi:lipid-A-disaccharide synthase